MSWFKKAVEYVSGACEKAVEYTWEKAVELGSKVVGVVKSVYTAIKGAGTGGVAKTQYHEDVASGNAIEDQIHEFLCDNQDRVDTLEFHLLEVCKGSFRAMINSINEKIAEQNRTLYTNELEHACEQVDRNYRGNLQKHVKRHFSLSDSLCKNAFTIRDPSERTQAIQQVWNNVVDEGMSKLGKTLRDYFSEQVALIQEAATTQLQAYRENAELETAQLKNVLELKSKDRVEQEKAKMRVLFAMDFCSVALDDVVD